MKRKVLREILKECKDVNSLDGLINYINNYKYDTDAEGKTVKVKIYVNKDGKVKAEILSVCDYKDIDEMNVEQLEAYIEELREQYKTVERKEPDEDDDAEAYEDWEDELSEIEDEIDSAKEKLEKLTNQE